MSRSVLLTGATGGMGRALAGQLARNGDRVFATGRNESRLKSLMETEGVFGEAFDLSRSDAPAALYASAQRAFGEVPDVVVNNAGFNSRKAEFTEVSEEEFDEQYRVNLRAPAILCRLALRGMREKRRGHLINVGSTVVLHACETMGVYSAMKHGLNGLTKVLIKEARPHGIKVTAVHPGGTDSGFRQGARPDYMSPDGVARMIFDVIHAPDDVVVHELVFRPLVETNF